MKRIVAPAVAALMAIGLASASHAAEKVIVAFTGASDYAAAFVAKDKGIFEKHGLDVELQLVANGGASTAAVTSGSAQFGGVTPSVMLPARANGLSIGIAAGALVSPSGSRGGLLARQGLDLSDPAAFNGKTVGVPGLNGALHVLSRKWLADKGVDVSKVNFVEVTFAQMPDALRGQQVDLVASADPFYGRIESAGVGSPVADILSIVPDGTLFSFYAATSEWADANPSTLKAFRDALIEAEAVIASDVDATRAAIGNYVKLPPEMLKALPKPNVKAIVTPDQISPWIEMARQQGMISADIDRSEVILK